MTQSTFVDSSEDLLPRGIYCTVGGKNID